MKDLNSLERASDSQLAEAGIETVARRIGRISQEFGEFDSLDESERKQLSRALQILVRLEAVDRNGSEVPRLVKIIVLGKLGEFAAAIDEASKSYEANRTWNTAITLANTFRRAGNLHRAIEMWSVAADLDPKDVTALLEIGDSYLSMKEWVAAIKTYERAVEREPDQAWAVPSIHYCQYMVTGDRNWLRRVQRQANKKPDECGVENILAQLTGSYSSDIGIQRAQQLLALQESDE